MFTALNSQQVQVKSLHKRHKYEEAVRTAGDQPCNAPFTPPGTPYLVSMEFLRKISHTGDMLPANAGRDAPRFIHESTSYVTTTHINHTIHACAPDSILFQQLVEASIAGLAHAFCIYCVMTL